MTKAFEGMGPEAQFQAYVDDGKFMIQRSKSSGEHLFYPRVVDPRTGKADLEWVPASGKGTVYATTATGRRPEQGGDYNISLVTLEEGPRMMSRVVGIDPDKVEIGMEVVADIQDVEGQMAVVFKPAGKGGK